ncbi:hypothetical protein V1520DRAFT_356295 [Lipomyces starkeyi]
MPEKVLPRDSSDRRKSQLSQIQQTLPWFELGKSDYRLFFHAVREYLKENPTLSVLSVTFRQPLARYLSKELDLNFYLDDGFFRPTSKDRMSRPSEGKRTCGASPDEGFDVARTLTAYLVTWYVKQTMPTVAFTTRSKLATMLLALLRKVAKERFNNLAVCEVIEPGKNPDGFWGFR